MSLGGQLGSPLGRSLRSSGRAKGFSLSLDRAIPTLSANMDPSGFIASASTESGAGPYSAFQAFDNNNSTEKRWASTDQGMGWVQAYGQSPFRIWSYILRNPSGRAQTQSAWQLIALGPNGALGQALDARTGETAIPSEGKMFILSDVSDEIYGVRFVALASGTTPEVGDIQFYLATERQ